MTTNETIKLYINAYESGSCDLRSANLWLRQLKFGVKLVAKNGIIIKVIAA
jgi:hypothetical protein